MSKPRAVEMGLAFEPPQYMRDLHAFVQRCAAGTDSFAAMLERTRRASNRSGKAEVARLLRLERQMRDVAAVWRRGLMDQPKPSSREELIDWADRLEATAEPVAPEVDDCAACEETMEEMRAHNADLRGAAAQLLEAHPDDMDRAKQNMRDVLDYRKSRARQVLSSDRLRRVFLAICCDACICDHMGDMWNGLLQVAEKLGIDLPMDELECEVDFDALQEMGAASVRELPDMSKVCSHTSCYDNRHVEGRMFDLECRDCGALLIHGLGWVQVLGASQTENPTPCTQCALVSQGCPNDGYRSDSASPCGDFESADGPSLLQMVQDIHAALPDLARESDLDDIPRRGDGHEVQRLWKVIGELKGWQSWADGQLHELAHDIETHNHDPGPCFICDDEDPDCNHGAPAEEEEAPK